MPPRILHIEDDPTNRLLVRKLLAREGFEVLEADNGLEGVRLARHYVPDLVLVDLNIPGLDGYEVTLRLRGERDLSSMPIVAITAEGDRSTSLAVGCDGFIRKPIDVRSFGSTLRGYLKGSKDEAPPSTRGQHLRVQSQRIVARLEAKVAELSEANEQLREYRRVRTSFYQNISHELATPMTPIVGYVRLLMDGELGAVNPDQQKALRAVHGSVERLRGLIDNLLDVTGLESGSMRFNFNRYNVGQAVWAGIERRRVVLTERGIRLVHQFPVGEQLAMGDAERLTRAVAQLVDNAAKFSERAERVGVRLLRRGDAYEICVADNGPGIPESMRESVLQPFFQADPTPTRKHGGVGVGLAIARKVAEGLGGGLQLESPTDQTIAGERFRGTACILRVLKDRPGTGDAHPSSR